MTADQASDDPHQLPAAVRSRVVALASDALAGVPETHVPPLLRRAMTFAPAKRRKLIGGQLTQALDADEEFREHLGTQVRGAAGELAGRVDAQGEIGDDELREAAALAYILRPDHWQQLVGRAERQAAEVEVSGVDLTGSVEKLQADLDRARGETKAVREKLRAQVEQVKSENAQLRRTLGETRVQLREVQDAAERDRTGIDAVRREAETAAREADAEQRRLRQRIEQLESDSAVNRRALRDDREGENMRLRLLLDTVMESASGLRRELALPPSDLLPADTVAAVDPGAASQTAAVGRALLADDPGLLRRLLELPRAHLILDGYNVSKTAWPDAPLDQQRSRLVSGVAALVAGKGIETTVVFDGADLDHPPGVTSPRHVRVRFSPSGVIADDLIRELVAAEPTGRPVIVVSTDREVAESVTKDGARSVASIALVKVLGLA